MIVLNRASKTRRSRDTTRSTVEERVDVYEKVTKTVVQEYSSLSVKVGWENSHLISSCSSSSQQIDTEAEVETVWREVSRLLKAIQRT